ncbi:hypothetical protein ACFPRL_08810 [Pseudoclavibacter helvolus]
MTPASTRTLAPSARACGLPGGFGAPPVCPCAVVMCAPASRAPGGAGRQVLARCTRPSRGDACGSRGARSNIGRRRALRRR